MKMIVVDKFMKNLIEGVETSLPNWNITFSMNVALAQEYEYRKPPLTKLHHF